MFTIGGSAPKVTLGVPIVVVRPSAVAVTLTSAGRFLNLERSTWPVGFNPIETSLLPPARALRLPVATTTTL